MQRDRSQQRGARVCVEGSAVLAAVLETVIADAVGFRYVQE